MAMSAATTIMTGQVIGKMAPMDGKSLGPGRRSTPDSDAVVSSDEDHDTNAPMTMSLHSVKSMPAHRPVRRASWLSEVHSQQRKFSVGGVPLPAGGSQPPTPSADASAAMWHPDMSASVPGLPVTGRPDTGYSNSSGAASVGASGSGGASSNSAVPSANPLSPANSVTPTASAPASTTAPFSWHSQPWASQRNLPHAPIGAFSPISASAAPFVSREPVSFDGSPSLGQSSDSLAKPLQHSNFLDHQASPGSQLSHPTPQPDVSPRVPAALSSKVNLGWSSVSNDVTSPTFSPPTTVQTHPAYYQIASPSTSSTQDDIRSPSSSSATLDSVAQSSIPFEIPLEPSRKTIRSQSYSSALKHVPISSTRRSSRPSLVAMDAAEYRSVDSPEPGLPASNPDAASELPSTSGPHSAAQAAQATWTQDDLSRMLEHQAMAHRGQRSTMGAIPEETMGLRAGTNNDSLADVTSSLDRLAFASDAVDSPASAALSNPTEGRDDSMYSPFHGPANRGRAGSAPVGRNLPVLDVERQFLDNIQVQASEMRQRKLYNRVAAVRYLSPGSDPSVRANQPIDGTARSVNEMTQRPTSSRMGAPAGAKLYLVSFKSNRADIFYLLPGFSFDPQPGDMVIVEGDRGHDLGIIQFANIDLEMAKAKREEYNIRHYRTLTMFSRMFPHVAAASGAEQFDAPTAAIAGHNLGQPRRRQDGTDEPPPMKAIRRVANLDEIQMLQEKEGNEARAKRICQSKVSDHGIRMEILDAEFQVDYKKLTFYFYAEQYVNFNDLVSDLFKVWKLRIWLSAVNPNSYPPPPAGGRRGRGHGEGYGFPDMRSHAQDVDNEVSASARAVSIASLVHDPANFAQPSQPDWAMPGYGAPQNQMQHQQNVGARGMTWNAGQASSPIAQQHPQPFSSVGYTGYEAFTLAAAAANSAYAAGGGRPASLTVRTAVPQPTSPLGHRRFMGGSPLTLTHSPVTTQMANPYHAFSRGPASASLDSMPSYGDAAFQHGGHHLQANRQSGAARWPSSAGLPGRADDMNRPEHGLSLMADPFMPNPARQTSGGGGFYSSTGGGMTSPASAPLMDPPPLPWRRGAPQSAGGGGGLRGGVDHAQTRLEEPHDMFPPLSGLGQSRRTG